MRHGKSAFEKCQQGKCLQFGLPQFRVAQARDFMEDDGIACEVVVNGRHLWTWLGYGSKKISEVVGAHLIFLIEGSKDAILAAACMLIEHTVVSSPYRRPAILVTGTFFLQLILRVKCEVEKRGGGPYFTTSALRTSETPPWGVCSLLPAIVRC